jgi:hypothetical protein
VQELGYRLGMTRARQVARDVVAHARKRRQVTDGDRWAGIHQSRAPLPPALARLFTRLRAEAAAAVAARAAGGSPVEIAGRIAGQALRRAVRRVGRRQVRRITRTMRRLPAAQARTVARHTRARHGTHRTNQQGTRRGRR